MNDAAIGLFITTKDRSMKIAPIALSLASLALPAAAIAQETRCIPQGESRAVVANLLPDIIESAAARCSTQLGGVTYLGSQSGQLVADLRPLARQSWPQAKVTLEEHVIGSELPDNPMVLELGRKAIAEGVTSELDAEMCSSVDRLVAEIAPLPPENFANVFALFLELGLNASEESTIRICPVN